MLPEQMMLSSPSLSSAGPLGPDLGTSWPRQLNWDVHQVLSSQRLVYWTSQEDNLCTHFSLHPAGLQDSRHSFCFTFVDVSISLVHILN